MSIPHKYQHLFSNGKSSDRELKLLEELLEEKLYEQSEKSLYSYFVNMWDTYDPQPLVPNWHIECICEHAQAAVNREIRRMIINIPPRMCLEANTKVGLSDGSYKPIKNINVGDVVFSTDRKNINTNKVLNVWNVGKKEGIKLTFNDGNYLKCSIDHKILTSNGYVKAKDIKLLDLVYTHSTLPNLSVLSSNDEELTLDDAFLIGLWLASGFKDTWSNFNFTSNSRAITNRAIKIASTKGWHYRKIRKNDKFIYSFIDKNKIKNWFESKFEYPDETYIPSCVFKASRKTKLEFLNIFIACSGWINTHSGRISGNIENESLAKDIYLLFKQLGYTPMLKEKMNAKYYLSCILSNNDKQNNSNLHFLKVTKIEYIGFIDCYDIEVENDHNFFADSVCVSNSKSTICSISLPTWTHIHRPGEKFWLISHSEKLFTQNIVYARRILDHPKYKNRWMNPNNKANYRFSLTGDVNLKTRVENNKGGYLLGGAPKVGALGMGFTVALLDDILDSEKSNSPDEIVKPNEWYTRTFLNRSNDRNNDVIIIIMQRLAENDLTGYVMNTYSEEDWFLLNLPARYDSRRTFVSPIGYNDKRTKDNELLDPIRLPDSALDLQDPIIYNTRYQQNPSAMTEGNFWRADWIEITRNRPQHYDELVTVWDLSFTNEPTSSYSVGLVMGLHEGKYYVVDMWRKKATIPDQINGIRKMKAKYPKATVAIEKRAGGYAAQSTLEREIPGIVMLNPQVYGGSKEQRLGAVTYIGKNKQFIIYDPPEYLDNNYKRRENLEPDYDANVIKQELLSFPIGAYNDIVDCISYGLQYLAQWGINTTAMITRGERIKLTDEDFLMDSPNKQYIPELYNPYTIFADIPSREELTDISW